MLSFSLGKKRLDLSTFSFWRYMVLAILPHTWDNIYKKVKVWKADFEVGMDTAALHDG